MNSFSQALLTTPLLLGLMVLAPLARAENGIAYQAPPQGRQTDFNMSSDLIYDSNVARSDRTVAARRGLTLEDEIAALNADTTISRQFGRSLLFVEANSSFTFHRVNPSRDHRDFDIGGGAAGHFGPCSETFVADYGQAQAEISELSLAVRSNTRDRQTLKFSAQCGRATGFAPDVSVTQNWTSNSAQQLRAIDSRNLTVDGGLAFRRSGIGSLAVFGQYTTASYPNRIDFTGSLSSGYEVFTGGVRYERHEGVRLDTVLSVSYTALDPSTRAAPRFRGFTFSLDATYSLSSRLAVHGEALRATAPTNKIFANYKVEETYGLDVTYKVGTKLAAKVSEERASDDYSGGTQQARSLDFTRETIYTTSVSLNYQLTKHFALSVSAIDEEREANFPGLSYSATKAIFGFKTRF